MRAVLTSGSPVALRPVASCWQNPIAATRLVIVAYALWSRTRSLMYSPTTKALASSGSPWPCTRQNSAKSRQSFS